MAKVIHTMIRVFDLDRSVRFYSDVLGLGVADHFDFDGFSLTYLRNEENDFEVELTLNKGQEEPYSHGSGYGHIGVCVDNVRETREDLVGKGYEPADVKEFFREGELLARFFFITDPDGYKIEFLERHGRYQ